MSKNQIEADAVPSPRSPKGIIQDTTPVSNNESGATSSNSYNSLTSKSTSSDYNIDVGSLPETAQTARPITKADESDYESYLPYFPIDLKEDNIDILIINAESDMKAANEFKEHLKSDIIVRINNKSYRPRIKLLQEFWLGASHFNLDLAFGKTLYVFLFVTKDFCDCTWTMLQGQACLSEAINDPQKRWCVIPVHTKPRKTQNYKLPMMLGSLRALNYYNDCRDQYYPDGVRRLIESKFDVLSDRDVKLEEKRKDFFKKNKENILKKHAYQQRSTRKISTEIMPETENSDLDAKSSSSDDYVIRVQRMLLPECVETRSDNNLPSNSFQASKVDTKENMSNVSTEQHRTQPLSFQDKSSDIDCDSGMNLLSSNSISFNNSMTIDDPVGNLQSPGLSHSRPTVDGPVDNLKSPNFSHSRPTNQPTQLVNPVFPLVSCPGTIFMSHINGMVYVQTPYGLQAANTIGSNIGQLMDNAPNIRFGNSNNYAIQNNLSMVPNLSNPFSYQQPFISSGQAMDNSQNATVNNGNSFTSQINQSMCPSSMLPNLSYPSFTHQPLSSSFSNFNAYSMMYPGIYIPNSQPSGHVSENPHSHAHPQPVPLNPGQQQLLQNSVINTVADRSRLDGDSSGSAPVQHIHHHHHKEITITSATNVVIGDKSSVITNMEGATNAESKDSLTYNLSDSNAESKESLTHNLSQYNNTIEMKNSFVESNNSNDTKNEASVPSADCHHDSIKRPVESEDMLGFPEHPEPCSSSREPTENCETDKRPSEVEKKEFDADEN